MAKHRVSWDEVEKEVALVVNMIRQLPAKHKVAAAVHIAFEVALWSSETGAGMLGVLELAKHELLRFLVDVREDDGQANGKTDA